MVAATFTPFNTDGELNLPIISQYADQMATSQMAGVFVCGTTGESLSLTVEERKAVLEAWVKATKRRFKVIAHVGTNSIHEGVELAKHAQECGADAVGAMAPSFFKPLTVKEPHSFLRTNCKCRIRSSVLLLQHAFNDWSISICGRFSHRRKESNV